jgi:hypothetical protein
MSQIYKVQLLLMSPLVVVSFILLAPIYVAYRLVSNLT